MQFMSVFLIRLLVVALATKGAHKERKIDNLVRMGIGKKDGRRHLYTTTITVAEVEKPEGVATATGRTMRAHLRRGHVRRQHYGPGNEFSKKIFIEPVFVNSDKEYVSLRDRYSVTGLIR
jgi:hypothetical protein